MYYNVNKTNKASLEFNGQEKCKYVIKSEIGEEKENASCDNTATTEFVDDGSMVEACYSTSVLKLAESVGYDSIPEFLARPYLCASGAWTNALLPSANITSVNPLDIITTNPHYANKIEGYNLIRATFHIRVVINANPFQQGMLLMHFLPQTDEVSVQGHNLAWRNANLTTKTQHPNVIIDCKDSVGVLSIPYVAPSSFYSFTTQDYKWGTVYLDVMARLQTVNLTNANVDYSVYCYFSDVELAAPIVAQSGKGTKYKSPVLTRETNTLYGGKTISNALNAVGDAAASLAGIPMLSAVAGPTNVLFKGAASIAGALGYSKPNVDTGIQPMLRTADRYSATNDGVDGAVPLALMTTQGITRSVGLSYTDQDEMSFNFLKTREAFIETTNWTASTAVGTTLYSKYINPLNLYSIGSTPHTTNLIWYTGPPVFYLSNIFQFWRGSIVIKFKFAKTAFHTGRLQVTWTPADTTVPVVPTLVTSDISLREIIDLSVSDEFELTLPYMVNSSYLKTDESSGYITIKVLNQLRAPDSVVQSIDMLSFIRGGSDFELQVPAGDPATSVAISPELGEDPSIIVKDAVGGVEPEKPSMLYAQHSIGENFSSVRQLLTRYSQIYFRNWDSAVYTNGVLLWPWFVGLKYLSLSSITSGSNMGGDMYSFIAPLYHFYRGSVKIRFTSTSPTYAPIKAYLDTRFLIAPTQSVENVSTTIGSTSTVNWATSTVASPGLSWMVTDNAIGVQSFHVPYYSKYKCSLVIPNSSNPYIPIDKSQPITRLAIVAPTQTAPTISRAIGEDFQFSLFLGCPPIYGDNV